MRRWSDIRHFCFFLGAVPRASKSRKGPLTKVQSVLSRFIHYEDKEARRAKGRRNRPPARSPCSARYKKTTTPETTISFSPLHSSFAEITEMMVRKISSRIQQSDLSEISGVVQFYLQSYEHHWIIVKVF